MTPKEILQKWIDCFNAADAVAQTNLYAQATTKAQFAQYGMLSIPDDVLDNYAQEMLKKKEA